MARVERNEEKNVKNSLWPRIEKFHFSTQKQVNCSEMVNKLQLIADMFRGGSCYLFEDTAEIRHIIVAALCRHRRNGQIA